MARARNVKPGFFKNEDLAECTPWARLCFIGLWTMADREGRLEDRPKKIKGELFAFDSIDVEPLLKELEQWGFIKRYQVNGSRFISVLTFVEHQAPHGTEKDSVIPNEAGYLTVNERGKNGYITGKTHLQHVSDTGALTVKPPDPEGGQNALNPESRILNPDSGYLNPESLTQAVVCKAMKAEGIADVNPGHLDLLALLDAGAELREFVSAAQTAAGKRKGFAYALGIVRKAREEAASAKPLHQGAMPQQAPSRKDVQLQTAALMTGAAPMPQRQAATEPETIDVPSRIIPS